MFFHGRSLECVGIDAKNVFKIELKMFHLHNGINTRKYIRAFQ